MNTKKWYAVILTVLLTTGCAGGPLYEWGGYEETLFVVYHEPAYKEQALVDYIEFVNETDRRRPLAPGLYAEAATFLLEQGDIEGAIKYYKLEYQHWPESQPMLEQLIANLEARQ